VNIDLDLLNWVWLWLWCVWKFSIFTWRVECRWSCNAKHDSDKI